MNKEELKKGNWIYKQSNSHSKDPVELILQIEDLEPEFAVCSELQFSETKEEIHYNDLKPIRLSESILKKMGFKEYEKKEDIQDFAGFNLYSFKDDNFAYDNTCLYPFVLRTLVTGTASILTVVPEGECVKHVHEFQNMYLK